MIDYHFKIDLQGERVRHSNVVFTAGDSQGYRLNFSFLSYGERLDVSEYALTVKAKRADGQVILDGGETDGTAASYVVADNMYSVPGVVELEIALVGPNTSFVTSCVLLCQARAGFGEESLGAGNVTPIIAKMAATAQKAELAAEEAKNSVEEVAAEFTEKVTANAAEISDLESIYAQQQTQIDGKVDKEMGKKLSTNDYDDTEKAKVSSAWDEIISLTANKVGNDDFEAFKSNTSASFSEILQAVDKKVDKIDGKGLSSNDYTDEEKKAVKTMPKTYANVLKGNKSGSMVRVDDVSPFEHIVDVHVSCPSGIDPSSVTVTQCGKNLFDIGTAEDYSFNPYSANFENGIIYVKETTSATGFIANTNMKYPSGTYTISRDYTSDTSTSKLVFRMYDSDGNVLTSRDDLGLTSSFLYVSSYSGFVYDTYSDNHYNDITVTIPDAVAYWELGFSARAITGAAISADSYIAITNVQVEAGTAATDYAAYDSTTYMPNTDGTLEGVVSRYPSMTLFTDAVGVTVDVEYNKDTNKVIENLVNAIISLGGNV